MASMVDRMDDAHFEMHTPLCQMCKNKKDRDFDPGDYLKPIITCDSYGEVLPGLDNCQKFECEKFDADLNNVKIYASILTKEQLAYIEGKK